jgi:queuine/archaeosine tRNA-ribosyltransferase
MGWHCLCSKYQHLFNKPIKKVHFMSVYSGKKKYMNPLEILRFLHKLIIKFDLIFI